MTKWEERKRRKYVYEPNVPSHSSCITGKNFLVELYLRVDKYTNCYFNYMMQCSTYN